MDRHGRTEIVLVRHGESEWSLTGRYAGRADVSLTSAGRAEMRALGPHLRSRAFDRVICSPLQRARDSCREAGLDGAMAVVDDLIEWDYGDCEGKTSEETQIERAGWSLWSDGAPGGETVEHVAARVDRVISQLRTVDGRAAVFAHRDVLRVLAVRWVGLPPQTGRLLSLATGHVSVLGYEGETSVIISWNHGFDPPGR